MSDNMSMDSSQTLCAVCGDIAIARNFDVWTCKSCKPFFRRNAYHYEELKCYRGYNCVVNIKTRRKCRRCRLTKCFAVGMRKDWIMTDEQRNHRRAVIEENRKRRQNTQDNGPVNEASVDYLPEDSSQDLEEVVNTEMLANTELSDLDIEQVDELISISEIIRDSFGQYRAAIDHPDQHSLVPRSFINYDTNMSEMEDYKLAELFAVTSKLKFDRVEERTLIKSKIMRDLAQHGAIFYENEVAKMVRVIKKMNEFAAIAKEDRLNLVKYGAVEMTVLRSIPLYDRDEQAWILPLEDNVASVSKPAVYMMSVEVLKTFMDSWNYILKECQFDALTAISLFNPNRPGIVGRDAIDVQQRVYMHLLKRYLLFKHRVKSESEDRFYQLMKILVYSQVIGKLERKYFYEVYPDVCGPLCKEIFNIDVTRAIQSASK